MTSYNPFGSRLVTFFLAVWVLSELGCKHEVPVADTAATSTVTFAEASSDTVVTNTATTSTVGSGAATLDLSALFATSTPPAALSEPAPLTIATAPNVDENLFMVQLLNAYYGNFPSSADSTREDVVSWLSSTRTQIAQARRVIRTRGLDPDIDTLYEGGVRFIDAYEDYLTSVGVIQNRSGDRAVTDALGSAWKGYKTSEDVEDTAQKFGMSKEDASHAAVFGGIISGLVEYSRREAERNEARAAAIAVQERALNEVRATVTSGAHATVKMLTRRHNWRTGEAGLDGFESKSMTEELKRRPRDPFLKMRYANIRVDKETATDVLNDAHRAAAAVELVPRDGAYDQIRDDYFADAAELACAAASTEAGIGGYSAHPSTAAAALSFARGYLAAYPGDTQGRGHVALARSLAFSGRYDEAVTAANVALQNASERWRGDRSFCYRYAAFLSLASDHLDYVGPWLRQAYKNGFQSVASVRDSPDLANFRRQFPREFEELTTEKIGYRVDFGFIDDDITLFNNSPFPVTNLSMTMTIRQGSTKWTPKLKCAFIAPGGSCKTVDAVSITGSRYDDVTTTYDCDQCVK